MKKIILLLAALCAAVACRIDNYPLPSETLSGRLVCPDGSPLITEQPNGFKIRLKEVVNGEISNLPQDFWGKADGTFFNRRIFKGTYVVQPIDGAFFTVDPVEVDIEGTTELTFEVTPFLTILLQVTTNNADVVVRYRIKKAEGAGVITTARVLMTKWNPNVGMNNIDYEVVRDLKDIDDSVITSTTYTDQIQDVLEPDVTYYVRVAALSANTAGRYNLSEVVKVEI